MVFPCAGYICYEALWVSRQASNGWCPYCHCHCHCILCFSTSPAEVECLLVVGSDAHLATPFCLNFKLNSVSSLSPRYVMFPSLQLPHNLRLPLSPACPRDLQQVSIECNACVRHLCVHVCVRMCMRACSMCSYIIHALVRVCRCTMGWMYVYVYVCKYILVCVFAYSPLCISPSHYVYVQSVCDRLLCAILPQIVLVCVFLYMRISLCPYSGYIAGIAYRFFDYGHSKTITSIYTTVCALIFAEFRFHGLSSFTDFAFFKFAVVRLSLLHRWVVCG